MLVRVPLAAQGAVLGSFYYGYICLQVLSGWIASPTRLGGRVVLAAGVLVWSSATMCTPVAARHGLSTFILCRVVMGLAEGVATPSIHALLGEYVPVGVRSSAVARSTSGQYLGIVVAMLSSPLIDRDWPAVFYIFGGAGLVWTVVFLVCVAPQRRRTPTITVAAVVRHCDGVDSDGGAVMVELTSLAPRTPAPRSPNTRSGTGDSSYRVRGDDGDDDSVRLIGTPSMTATATAAVSPLVSVVDGCAPSASPVASPGDDSVAREVSTATAGASSTTPTLRMLLLSSPLWGLAITHFCQVRRRVTWPRLLLDGD